MEITEIIKIILEIIGGSTILLNIMAPLTKNKMDDKVLSFLKRLLQVMSLNVENNQLVINLKRK
jgi:hypothetical protein|tara:strand:- start:1929 stop:2120 length:192 start_codon:yes stop_codon:yes gene_type:complete